MFFQNWVHSLKTNLQHVDIVWCSVVAVGMLLCMAVIVKSSAYNIMLILVGGVGGVSCMYILEIVGDRMEH